MRTLRRGLHAVAAGLALVFLGAIPAHAAPAHAAPKAGQVWYYLENFKTTPNGQPLFLAVCCGLKGQAYVQTNTGAGNMTWTFQASGNYLFLRNAGTNQQLALSILNNSSANGTPVVQYTYQATNNYQKWHREAYLGGYQYRNLGTNKCLAISGGGAPTIPTGSGAIIYDCPRAGYDQVWTHVYVSG